VKSKKKPERNQQERKIPAGSHEATRQRSGRDREEARKKPGRREGENWEETLKKPGMLTTKKTVERKPEDDQEEIKKKLSKE
jgi:hypothetical protein